MPKRPDNTESSIIIDCIGNFPNGANIAEIASTLASPLSPRALQRRLARLIKEGQIIRQGRARASRYKLSVRHEVPTTTATSGTAIKPSLSPEAQAIWHKVHQPIQNRRPVGYNRAFLDAYHPNETFYLPAALRKHLSEAGQSQEERRPAGTFARLMLNRLLIDLSWNSSRLEGNTYSLLETEYLLDFGKAALNKNAMETQMILNHKAAIEFLVEGAEDTGFNRYTILNLHALLSNNLLSNPAACGQLRQIPVGIAGTVYHPLNIPQIIEEGFQQILDTAAAILDPFEQAFFAMVHLPYLQPFEDVNKRVSRLSANLPLIRENLCPLSFVDVSEKMYVDGLLGVYECNETGLLRDVFVWAYERSCARYSAVRKSLGEPDPFRLHYRDIIQETVSGIVKNKMDRPSAIAFIRMEAEKAIPADQMTKFIETAETEILGLHEGNIARFRLKPSEYRDWQIIWQRSAYRK